jgi:hypothetical protein
LNLALALSPTRTNAKPDMCAVAELDGLFLDMPSVRTKDVPLIGPIHMMQGTATHCVERLLRHTEAGGCEFNKKIGVERH